MSGSTLRRAPGPALVGLRAADGEERVPVLLIASNAPDEATLNRAFRRAIGPLADLWYVPDATHTKALDRHPAAYVRRVDAFLEAALSRR